MPLVSQPKILQLIDNLIPSQTGQNNKFLQTTGSSLQWATINPEEAKEFVTDIETASDVPTTYTFPTGYTYIKGINQLTVILGGAVLSPTYYEEDSEASEGDECNTITLNTPVKVGEELHVRIHPKSYIATNNLLQMWKATVVYGVGDIVYNVQKELFVCRTPNGPGTTQGVCNPSTAGNEAIWEKQYQGNLNDLLPNARDSLVAAINYNFNRIEDVYQRTRPSVISMTWSDVQGYTRAGTASQNFNLGDKFQTTYNGKAIEFTVIGFDYDIPASSDYTHTTTLQLTKMYPDTRTWKTAEADYYTLTALEAGTYYFQYGSSAYYHFTTTTGIPANGQIVFSNGRSFSATNNAVIYSSPSSLTALDTCLISSGQEGTSLGRVDTFVPVSGLWNHGDRRNNGGNIYNYSFIKQWINSEYYASAADRGWWTPIGPFDRPPEVRTYGFAYYLDSSLLDCVGLVKKRTAYSSVDGAGTYEDTNEKLFLLSRMELDGTQVNGVSEGPVLSSGEARAIPYPYYERYSAQDDRVLYNSNGSKVTWWLRSPNSGSARYAWGVVASGAFDWHFVYTSRSASPALAIV